MGSSVVVASCLRSAFHNRLCTTTSCILVVAFIQSKQHNQLLTLSVGDLLGDSTAAPPAAAAAADSGGMFAGLDVGISGQSANNAALESSSSLLSGLDGPSAMPQSPVDALAGLQGLSATAPAAGEPACHCVHTLCMKK